MDKEQAFMKELSELFQKYGITYIGTKFGYYEEQKPYVTISGGDKKLYLEEATLSK